MKPQKDRWELTSPRQIPHRFVEVILWRWQVELGRLSNRPSPLSEWTLGD